MKKLSPWWLWLVLVLPVAFGFFRLRLDVDLFGLLPADVGAVQGLKLYQRHFTDARKLIMTVRAGDAPRANDAVKAIADALRAKSDLVSEVLWQAPWTDHPEQAAEFVAYLWMNQPPEVVSHLLDGLAPAAATEAINEAREQLATTLSPMDIALISRDPLGFTRLPESIRDLASGFGPGGDVFASADGKFHLIFIRSAVELDGYQECTRWLEQVRATAEGAVAQSSGGAAAVSLGYSGRPAFVAEISASMRRDMIVSVIGTSVIIAGLFWLAHRRIKPMAWLLVLLLAILVATLGLGGLVFGTISVVSMGFAAILLGLAVDYAVVHYQEALAQPELSIPEVRAAIAPSIFWAAITTITAFLVLNLGGLPGLGQLGSLVGMGVAIAAAVMIFAFLPPLFPERMKRRVPLATEPAPGPASRAPVSAARLIGAYGSVGALLVISLLTLIRGFPGLDASSDALRPRDSQAYRTLDAIKEHLGQKHEPLTVVVEGRDEQEVADRLQAIQPVATLAVSNGLLSKALVPVALWPNPANQKANGPRLRALSTQIDRLRQTVVDGGFTTEAFALEEKILENWNNAGAATTVRWPSNQLSRFLLDNFAAHGSNGFLAAAFLHANESDHGDRVTAYHALESRLSASGVSVTSWDYLGAILLQVVKGNFWKLLIPMVGLVLLSLWLAFRHPQEVCLSLGTLAVSAAGLMAVMKLAGWSWNLLNLMSAPLILGAGVDYSIFMQLALRRHGGDLLLAHRSVGRALLLCGGTAVAGFGSLAFSSNAGMSSLGQTCAVGIAFNVFLSVVVLPVAWKSWCGPCGALTRRSPSSLYGAQMWRLAVFISGVLPIGLCRLLMRAALFVYRSMARHRCEIVTENLAPLVEGDPARARVKASRLFDQFALKLVDLWCFESGKWRQPELGAWTGWEHLIAARAGGRGVLLVTPHLGNWEFGGAFLAAKGVRLLVLTQAEPDDELTEFRQRSRARYGIETFVVGADAFGFVEVIKRLQDGAMVALLVDRPPAATAVTIELFGRPFEASIAAAELARASGCAVLPAVIVRAGRSYEAQLLPAVEYERSTLGNRTARIRFTQEILRAFEPSIRQHAAQWFHFVPIWPPSSEKR